MRYTTVIDISELPGVYGNVNARLLYLHMVLKCGYHDEDRDQLRASIRQLAAAVGLTLSATRHALRVLGAASLVAREGEIWRVRKFVVSTPPTPRTQKNTAKGAALATNQVQTPGTSDAEKAAAQKAYQERVLTAVRSCTPDELAMWLHELQEGRSLNHHGVYIRPNKENVEWLKNIIEGK